MKLRRLSVKNFRGIREMDWKLAGDMVCLIGPGDSTKSTILLALEYLFSGSWALSVSDIDFHDLDVDAPIEIEAVVTGLPDSLIAEDKDGLFLGFWNPAEHSLYEEQEQENYQNALKMRLEIARDLEPKWTVVSLQENGREPLSISATDRRALGVAKIGNYTEADLAWGRNSALSRLTEKDDIAQIPAMLANAERQVLKALESMDLSALSEIAQEIAPLARGLGIDEQTGLGAGLDPMRISIRQGAIALFDGKLPLALRGAGSRRIMAMAISKAAVKEGAVILVDEVENSLEPHRLRHLIRQLRPRKNDLHQVILTTHSPIAVVECQATELHVVRSENGKTTAQQVEHGLQAVARKIPEAFLSKKVCICEGKTEAGLLIGLDAEYWHRKHETDRPWFKYRTMAEAGVAPIADPRGGGDEAPKLTLSMASLGYQVAFFGDSDKADKLTPSVREMEAAEIEVILWPGEKQNGLSVEERICLDLPVGGLEELVTLAVELESNEDKPDDVWRRIHDTLNSKGFRFQSDKDIRTLIQQSDEKAVRAAIGESAKHKNAGWFKRVEKGTRLGELLSHHLDSMQRTPTFDTLARLENWIYEPEF